MPSSRPNTIPTVIHVIRQLKPKSILDVGVGFGKWGHLFREYTDINAAEQDPARYQRKNWQVRIDGIEGHVAYLTEMHHYLYNEIHVGDACEMLPRLPKYDVIFMGDIIEHLEKERGRQLLTRAIEQANMAVIVSTPKYETEQRDLCGNELEKHRSLWTRRDFQPFDGAIVKTIDGATLLAVIPKPGVPRLQLTPPKQPYASALRRLREAKAEIAKLIPVDEPFILIDEEQLRGELPHRRALPFLERDGSYWGPPAEDAKALGELNRLIQAGARWLVIVWPCFWWLEHYARFAEHLRTHHHCMREDKLLIVFDLTKPR